MENKKYGLILPDRTKPAPKFQSTRNVFGDESDSEGESKKKLALLRPSDNIHRQAKISQEKAISEDPTVYQYDEIYDEMVSSKEKENNKNKQEKKPKYIENLIKSANKRKIENERRIERQIQKEREKEGEEFKDKEVFVTSAYKKKLEEMREEEEKEKREEYLESIGDVTKQKDLGGFYRHLYEQKLGSDKGNKDDNSSSNAIQTPSTTKTDNTQQKKSELMQKRNYRKRKSTEKSLSEGEIEESDEEVNRLNLNTIKISKKNKKTEGNIDADSDFSIDESSDEETNGQDIDTKKHFKTMTKKSNTPEPIADVKKEKLETKNKVEPVSEIVAEVKPKIDIWKKRTVGEVFDQALKRYYERKAARGS